MLASASMSVASARQRGAPAPPRAARLRRDAATARIGAQECRTSPLPPARPAMAAPALEVTPTDVTGVTFSFYTDDEVGESREEG